MNNVEAIEKKLDEMFPSKNLLSMSEVSQYTGLSLPYCRKLYGVSKNRPIDKTVLARMIVGGAE